MNKPAVKPQSMSCFVIDPVELTQKLIRCPSVTPEDKGAQDVLIDVLKPLGFEIHDVTFGDVRNTFFRIGTSAPHLCFCGHTDVVPTGDIEKWTYPPFAAEIHDGKLYGRGASDMKGGIAAFVAALAQYLESNEPKCSISLLITSDEEGAAINGTVKVLEWMKDNNHIPDMALVGEPTNPQSLGDEVKIGRRGSLNGVLTVTGKQGHVAYPHLADNPLPKLVALLDALVSYEFDTGSDYFSATNLELTTIDTGNKAVNVTPESAKAQFNVRFNDKWSAESLGEKIRDILNGVTEDYELDLTSGAESFITKPGALSDIVTAAVQSITGNAPKLTTTGGTSDARFVQKYCPVVEFGLINKTIHQIDEYAEIGDIQTLTEIYSHILENTLT